MSKLLQSLLSTVLKTDNDNSVQYHLNHYLSLDPACCDRQHAVSLVREWAASPEGQEELSNLRVQRSLKSMQNAGLEYRRAVSTARTPWRR